MRRELVEVWLVEDNDDDVLMIELGLAETGPLRVVQVCRDGREFLTRLDGHPGEKLPHLVLLDINMPRLNGFEVIGAMKADSRLRHIPVVVLTSSGHEKDVWRAYEAGACSYVVKPSGYEQLLEVFGQFAAYWSTISRTPSHRGDG